MAWTQHGHQIIGTIAEDPESKPPTKRCGGPKLCDVCANDEKLAQLRQKLYGPPKVNDQEITRRAAIAAYNVVYLEILRSAEQTEHVRGGLYPETVAVNDRMIGVLGMAADYILMSNGLDRKFLDEFHAKNREAMKDQDESGKE